LVEALSESTDNILGSIASSLGLHILDILFHVINIICESFDGESVSVTVVSVSNKADSNIELSIIVVDNIVNNLFESILCSSNP